MALSNAVSRTIIPNWIDRMLGKLLPAKEYEVLKKLQPNIIQEVHISNTEYDTASNLARVTKDFADAAAKSAAEADAAADFFPTADEESVGGLQHSGAAGRHLLGCHDGCLCQRQSEAGNLCGQRCVGHGCDSADAWPVSRNATGRIETRKGSADAAPTDLAHRAHAGHRPAIV